MGVSAAACFGVAGLGFGGLWGLAVGLYVHHARRARVPAFARDPSVSIQEGPVVLGGIAEGHTVDEDPSAVLAVAVPAPPARGRRMHGRPFALVLPSGATIGVEPEEGRWSLDTTFVPNLREGQTTYEAIVFPGDTVYARGYLRREHDPRASGRAYRDTARRWVLRGDLAFSSATMIAAHAQRAAFHRDWALALAALFAAAHVGLWAACSPSSILGSGSGLLAVALVLGASIAYRIRAEDTALWLQRKVRLR